ncbi:MAG: hypothetical protein KBS91_01700 [Firmicutes bacterium]|nr:hypothetical protein [Candidatus Caballimonas caccae]
MKGDKKNKIFLPKKTKIWVAIICSLIIVISFFCGFFTYKLSIGNKKTTVNWAIDMIDKFGCYYDEDTGEVKKFSKEDYIKMITSSLDNYSTYYTKEEYNAELRSNKGNAYGVGLTFRYDRELNEYSILRVLWNSPAEKAGLKEGDIINSAIKNNQETIFGLNNSIVDFINSVEDDEEVTFNITRGSENKTFTVKREVYVINYVKYMDKESTLTFTGEGSNSLKEEIINSGLSSLDSDTAYIGLYLFEGNAESGFATCMNYLKERNKTKLILDLRNNGGGFMNVLESIASYLVKSGNKKSLLVVAKDNEGKEEKFYSNSDKFNNDITKIVVLANENTASASECLIGAMLYYKTAFDTNSLIIEKHKDSKTGEMVASTYGKGIMQTTYKNYLTGEAIKLTTAGVFQPDGVTSIHKKGITTTSENSVDRGTALSKAISLLVD